MQPLISVIVPIYKVEKYLSKCIDSITSQEYNNLEIFLVDDGSPDQCGKICDEHASKDSRIKVIHKTNGGLSDARNVALDIMTGEYVTFIDSDDFVSPIYVSTLWNILNKYESDIAVSQHIIVNEGDQSISKAINNSSKCYILERDEALETMFYQRLFDNAAWGKLYKSSLFKNIRYPKGLIYEDLGTTYKLLLLSKTIAYTPAQTYFYLQRNDSIEGEAFNAKKMDAIPIAKELLETIILKNPQNIKAAQCRCVSLYWHVLLSMPKSHSQEKILIKFIKKHRLNILVDKRARNITKIACILSLISFNLVKSLFNRIK